MPRRRARGATPSSTSSTDTAIEEPGGTAGGGGSPRLLEVGHVVRPHGLRGEVVVSLVTNRLERLGEGSLLLARLPAGERRLEVLAARPQRDRFLVSLAGVTDRDSAEQLRGAVLLAEPLAGGEDEWFVHELIGATLRDQHGRRVGEVTAVQANPASDLLVVDGQHLVPLRFVRERRPGELLAELPEGLIE